MKFWIACVVLGLAAQQAFAEELFDDSQLAENEARFLFMNTSGTAAGLTLLGALILLGVIAYLIYAGGILGGSTEMALSNTTTTNTQTMSNNMLNIDLYERFDYNDLECQKRLICEVMREPDYYGAAAEKFKAGFQYAKYLEVLSLPDDMRELLDEYLDANSRADQNKECEEFFQCPYSIKDSFKRNISGNSL
eukprot:TCALIF_03765-PB protein Name:"Protein of unknown function" AED:0.05 eAED:0.05 QI:5/0.33/0.25/1/0.33/0.5/4/1842/192